MDIIALDALKPYQNKNLLHQKYVVESLSVKQISRQFFCSSGAVHSALVNFGIPRREAKNTSDRVQHLMYGKKMENGKAVDSLSQMRVVKTILGFNEEGMSLRQICKFLAATGVPTKTGKAKWHPTMVNRIISHYGEKVKESKSTSFPTPSKIDNVLKIESLTALTCPKFYYQF